MIHKCVSSDNMRINGTNNTFLTKYEKHVRFQMETNQMLGLYYHIIFSCCTKENKIRIEQRR